MGDLRTILRKDKGIKNLFTSYLKFGWTPRKLAEEFEVTTKEVEDYIRDRMPEIAEKYLNKNDEFFKVNK